MDFDLTPVIQAVVALAVAALTTFGTILINRLADKLKIEKEDKVRDYLRQALDRAVDFAAAQALAVGGSLTSVQVKSAAINIALQYVLPKVPDALETLKLTPASVREMIEARFANPALGLVPAAPLPLEGA